MTAVSPAAKIAARKLSKDLTALKTDRAAEARALERIDRRLQRELDAFISATPSNAGNERGLLNDMFSLVQKKTATSDRFDARIARELERGQELLPQARPALSVEQRDEARVALGLKELKAPDSQAGGKSGKAVVELAHSLLGKDIAWLKQHGPLVGYLDKWVSNKVCCANFVTACLARQGMIDKSQHTDHTKGIARILGADPQWRAVSSQHLKVGDVVCFNVPGEGPYSHVEFFNGYKNGRATFIGSNNVNSDGTQRISVRHGYPIAAVFRYHG